MIHKKRIFVEVNRLYIKEMMAFFDICNSCLEKLIEKYMLELNDSDEVIKRMCLHLDIFK